MVLKLLSLGSSYFYDSWNKFDFVIVIGTDIGVVFHVVGSEFNISAITTAFRAFRIMRMFKLIKSNKNLRVLLDTLLRILPSISNVASMVLLILFIYTCLGMQLFGRVMLRDEIN